MNARDVNRINYNNYFVGQNLDFLVRSKMRSESLSSPLKNTPPFYDDQVSSKMSLLGKRGFYDPGYIYGFYDQNENTNEGRNPENMQKIQNEEDIRLNQGSQGENLDPIYTKEQYEQMVLPKEQNQEQFLNEYEMYNNPNIPNNNNNYNKYLNERNINIQNNELNNNLNNNLNKMNNENNNYYDMNNRNQYNDEMLYKERQKMLQERQTP